MTLYSLIEKKDTEELHLFKSNKTPLLGDCLKEPSSICRGMNMKEKGKIIFECENEQDARMKCAKIGRKVCGTCVSHLYSNY